MSTAIAYPINTTESGSGDHLDSPTNSTELPVDENTSCNAAKDEAAYKDAVNSLNKGLILLKRYSHTVNYHSFVS